MISGTVISHPKFVFHDGGISDKILISLGSDNGTTVMVKTTSRGYRHDYHFGCQCEHRHPSFHLVQNSCFLEKPTWVCLNEFYEFNAPQLFAKRRAGHYREIGILPQELNDLLVQCVLQSNDISGLQERIVRRANGV